MSASLLIETELLASDGVEAPFHQEFRGQDREAWISAMSPNPILYPTPREIGVAATGTVAERLADR